MKTARIFVAIESTRTLGLSGGHTVKAMLPAGKGEKSSYALTQTGEIVRVAGARIDGKGIPRFLQESGYVQATPDDAFAKALADHVDGVQGVKLVEDEMINYSRELQASLSGKECKFISFEDESNDFTAIVSPPGPFYTVALGIGRGLISTASVKTDYKEGEIKTMNGFNLGQGWIVPLPAGESEPPRASEYGGPVEMAVYCIANSGIGSLVGATGLAMNEDEEDMNFIRGRMAIRLKNGDLLNVGITAVDELYVEYVRGDSVLYSREGLNDVTLRGAVASIAAVLVRVKEMDEAPVKKSRKKAA